MLLNHHINGLSKRAGDTIQKLAASLRDAKKERARIEASLPEANDQYGKFLASMKDLPQGDEKARLLAHHPSVQKLDELQEKRRELTKVLDGAKQGRGASGGAARKAAEALRSTQSAETTSALNPTSTTGTAITKATASPVTPPVQQAGAVPSALNPDSPLGRVARKGRGISLGREIREATARKEQAYNAMKEMSQRYDITTHSGRKDYLSASAGLTEQWAKGGSKVRGLERQKKTIDQFRSNMAGKSALDPTSTTGKAIDKYRNRVKSALNPTSTTGTAIAAAKPPADTGTATTPPPGKPGMLNNASNWVKKTWHSGPGGRAALIGGGLAIAGGLAGLGYLALRKRKPREQDEHAQTPR